MDGHQSFFFLCTHPSCHINALLTIACQILFWTAISTKKSFSRLFSLVSFLAPRQNTIKENLCYKKICVWVVVVDMGSVKSSKKCKLGKKTILWWKFKKKKKPFKYSQSSLFDTLGICEWKCVSFYFYVSCNVIVFKSLYANHTLWSIFWGKPVHVKSLIDFVVWIFQSTKCKLKFLV